MPLTKAFQSLGSTTEMTGDSQHSFDKIAKLTASTNELSRLHGARLLTAKGLYCREFPPHMIILSERCLSSTCPHPEVPVCWISSRVRAALAAI